MGVMKALLARVCKLLKFAVFLVSHSNYMRSSNSFILSRRCNPNYEHQKCLEIEGRVQKRKLPRSINTARRFTMG